MLMWQYSVVMFAVAVLLLVFGVLIYRGNTQLIHSYHQTRVKDKEAYGKGIGKALMVLAAALVVSGIVALLGTEGSVVAAALGVLFAGITAGFIFLLKVQKKYNNGLF